MRERCILWRFFMLTSLLRTFIMYGAILLSVRIMGKRQVSQLQNSELVVTLLISELAVMPIQQQGDPLWNGLIPMAALVLCEIVVSLLMLKSGRFRQAVCGKPIVVIEKGRVLQGELRRLRMSTEDLFEELRQSGCFSLEDVEYAIVETNGAMSLLKKAANDSLTPKQAGVKVDSASLEVVVVSDGCLSSHSLELVGKTPAWAREQARCAGLELSEVFIMTARPGGKCKVIPKDKRGK